MPKFLVHVHEETDRVYLVDCETAEDAELSGMQWHDGNLWEDLGGDESVTSVEEYTGDE